MGNFAHALGQGVLGGAMAVGQMADAQLKEEAEARAANRQLDIQQRLDASREMLRQQAKEWEWKKAGERAAEIDADAQGILSGNQVQKVRDLYENQDLTREDMADEELAAMAPSDADKMRARVQAAEKKGYIDEAKEGRAALDTERRFNADEARTAAADRKNDILEQTQQRMMDRQQRLAEITAMRDASRESAAEAKDRRDSIKTLLDSASKDIKALNEEKKELSTSGGDEKELAAKLKSIDNQIAALRRQEATARNALGEAVGILSGGSVDKKPLNLSEYATGPAASPPPAKPAAASPAAPKKEEADPTPEPARELGKQVDAAKSEYMAIRNQRAPGTLAGRAAQQAYTEKLNAAKKKYEELLAQYQSIAEQSFKR